jgi:hypothetical protein
MWVKKTIIISRNTIAVTVSGRLTSIERTTSLILSKNNILLAES